jgi:hypothetical protein
LVTNFENAENVQQERHIRHIVRRHSDRAQQRLLQTLPREEVRPVVWDIGYDTDVNTHLTAEQMSSFTRQTQNFIISRNTFSFRNVDFGGRQRPSDGQMTGFYSPSIDQRTVEVYTMYWSG